MLSLFIWIILFTLQNKYYYYPYLQMEKLSQREVEWLVHSRIVSKWQSWHLSPGTLVPEPVPLTT